jgi:hypothetical protein
MRESHLDLFAPAASLLEGLRIGQRADTIARTSSLRSRQTYAHPRADVLESGQARRLSYEHKDMAVCFFWRRALEWSERYCRDRSSRSSIVWALSSLAPTPGCRLTI